MRLDENSRMRVLASSLRAGLDRQADERHVRRHRADEALRPRAAAHDRAAQAGTEPNRLAAAMDLPPEVAEQIALLLAPSPRSEADCGVPPEADTEVDRRGDRRRRGRDRPRATGLDRLPLARFRQGTGDHGRDIARAPDRGIRQARSARCSAVPQRDGAFQSVREALRRLDQLAADPALVVAVEQARLSLQDPEVLADVCRAPFTDSDAAIAGEILTAAGPTGSRSAARLLPHGRRGTTLVVRARAARDGRTAASGGQPQATHRQQQLGEGDSRRAAAAGRQAGRSR